jgi:hypothetical protein
MSSPWGDNGLKEATIVPNAMKRLALSILPVDVD